MNERDKIIDQIASVEIPFDIMGSIIKCRYCRKFDAHMPNTLDINQRLKHANDCVWERSKMQSREHMLNPHVTYIVKGPIDEHTDDVCNSMHMQVLPASLRGPYMPPHKTNNPDFPCRCDIEGTTMKIPQT